MKTLIKTLGSIYFALFLIGALVVLLTCSTLLESAYGTPFAQRIFYQAGWFDIFLSLVAVNILCSALSRWPYKLHHVGFLVTHAGILLLLIGSLLSRIIGTEGQMALSEGGKSGVMLQQEYQLAIHEPEKKVHVWKLDSFSKKKGKRPLPLDHPSRQLTLEKIEEGVFLTSEIKPGSVSPEKNRAVRFTLHSQMAKLDESFWLIEQSEDPSFSRRLSVGLAEIELREGKAGTPLPSVSETPKLRLTKKNTGKTETLPLVAGAVADATFSELGVTVTSIVYYPDAQVNEENKLVNGSDTPKNPAVRFTLDDGKGQREERVLFTLFPDFESIHGKKSDVFKDIKVELLAPRSELAGPKNRSGLNFYFSEDGWSYDSTSKNGTLTGPVKIGETTPTGWMDFSFQVEELLDNAVIEKKVVSSGSSKKGDVGVLLSLTEDGKPLGTQWVLPNEPATFDTPEGPLAAALGVQRLSLPFELKLLDFRKKIYPGTENPSSFESDVLLEDPVDHVTIQKTIWMNHPLDYKGYRIFQSSYIQDPDGSEASVFTVAKNPGIILIYGGAIIMFIGIIFVFYVKPFSYFTPRSSRASSKK